MEWRRVWIYSCTPLVKVIFYIIKLAKPNAGSNSDNEKNDLNSAFSFQIYAI